MTLLHLKLFLPIPSHVRSSPPQLSRLDYASSLEWGPSAESSRQLCPHTADDVRSRFLFDFPGQTRKQDQTMNGRLWKTGKKFHVPMSEQGYRMLFWLKVEMATCATVRCRSGELDRCRCSQLARFNRNNVKLQQIIIITALFRFGTQCQERTFPWVPLYAEQQQINFCGFHGMQSNNGQHNVSKKCVSKIQPDSPESQFDQITLLSNFQLIRVKFQGFKSRLKSKQCFWAGFNFEKKN